MKQRPQYLLAALADAGHEVWFVDPRLRKPRTVASGIRLVPSLRMTPSDGVILYVHFAPVRTLVDRYEDKVVVYDLLDDLEIYKSGDRGMARRRTVEFHHRPLVKRADLVLVSNPILMERHRSERDDLVLIENGVDLKRFAASGPTPDTLPDEQIIGFHGAIAPWIDFDLIESVARLRPELLFVLVGPVDPLVGNEATELASLSNVRLMPAQPSDRIAEFVRGFSVGILPFVIEEMTEAVTPLKMYEYLACEVPVVATPLPACVDHPAVRTASDADSFAAELDIALEMSETQRGELRAHAEDADWARRVVPLLRRLEELGMQTVS